MARQLVEEITYHQLSQIMASDRNNGGEKPLEELFSRIKRKLSQPFVNMEQYMSQVTGVGRPNRVKNNRRKRHSLHGDSLNYQTYERIELAHFGDNLFAREQNERTFREEEHVTGHDFVLTPITNPAFCDYCRDAIWGMTKKCLRCSHCKYTCHHRCRQQVRLDCEPGPSAHSDQSSPTSRLHDTSPPSNNHYTPLATIPLANRRPDDGLASIATLANGDLSKDFDHDSAAPVPQRHSRRHSASASSPVLETPPSPPKTPSTAPQTPPVVNEDDAPSEEEREQPAPVNMITAVGSSHTMNGGVVSASEVSVVISSYATAPLRQRLDIFNQHQKKPDTLHLTDADTFQGFIRVTLNLSRPINMSVGARPPSIYDLLAHQEGAPPPLVDAPPRLETMSFYIPKDTIKSLHISSKTTAGEVIAELLHKFNITDSPRKFALYEQHRDQETKQLNTRRVAEKECPLELWLAWQEVGQTERRFLLQENESGDIMWEAFSVPELHNFLRILQREEEEHITQIRTKYKLSKLQLNVKMRDAVEFEKTQGKLEFAESGERSEPVSPPEASESHA